MVDTSNYIIKLTFKIINLNGLVKHLLYMYIFYFKSEMSAYLDNLKIICSLSSNTDRNQMEKLMCSQNTLTKILWQKYFSTLKLALILFWSFCEGILRLLFFIRLFMYTLKSLSSYMCKKLLYVQKPTNSQSLPDMQTAISYILSIVIIILFWCKSILCSFLFLFTDASSHW